MELDEKCKECHIYELKIADGGGRLFAFVKPDVPGLILLSEKDTRQVLHDLQIIFGE